MGKTFTTSGTAVRFFACVGLHVAVEASGVSKSFGAYFTSQGFFTSMDSYMNC
jgi:hypothetical protein